MEQTFIMIKPDGVQRGLVGEIIGRFEKKGFSLKGLKLMNVDQSFAEKHYEDLSAKPFFPKLVDYIISGPVVAMVWEGKNVVTTGRNIIGATNPSFADPGSIRGDFAVDIGRNVIHGSDAVESARKEIALWFPEGIVTWESSLHPWIYDDDLVISALRNLIYRDWTSEGNFQDLSVQWEDSPFPLCEFPQKPKYSYH